MEEGERNGMIRCILMPLKPLLVGDCLIQTKAEQRREEKFIKIWASVDLQ